MVQEKFNNELWCDIYSGKFFKRSKSLKRWMIKAWRFLLSKVWLILLVNIVVTVVLGYWGFYLYLQAEGRSTRVFDVLYMILQMFSLNSEIPPNNPGTIQLLFARVFVLFSLLLFGGETFTYIFKAPFKLFRIKFARQYVVICGVNHRSIPLIKDFYSQQYTVIAIDGRQNNHYLERARESGAITFEGSYSDVLGKVGLFHCKYVVIMTKDDLKNVEIAIKTFDVCKDHKNGRHVHCFVHLQDYALIKRLENYNLLEDDDKSHFSLHFFDIYQNVARLLFQRYPLDQFINSRNMKNPHILLIEFGELGKYILTQAAKNVHFSGDYQLKISVLDVDAEHERKCFLEEVPLIGEICTLDFIKFSPTSKGDLKEIITRLYNENPFNYIIICPDDDHQGFLRAIQINEILKKSITDHKRLQIPVLVHMKRKTGFSKLDENVIVDGGETRIETSFIPFGMVEDVCRKELVVNNAMLRVARLFQEDYHAERKKQRKSLKTNQEPMKDWMALKESLKQSNLHVADHIPVKLRAAGYDIFKLPPSKSRNQENETEIEFTGPEIEIMATIEHKRWMAERLLSGYVLNKKIKATDHVKMESPYLIPYSELEDNVKIYDQNSVKLIPKALRLLKLGLKKVGPGR
ncbi:MAG: NAD-binding protein [Promethearchaeota archaeon]